MNKEKEEKKPAYDPEELLQAMYEFEKGIEEEKHLDKEEIKPELVEQFACNGEHSHYILINSNDGKILWNEIQEQPLIPLSEAFKFVHFIGNENWEYNIFSNEFEKYTYKNNPEDGELVDTKTVNQLYTLFLSHKNSKQE